MADTLIGTYSTKEFAEREGRSIQADAPEGVEIVLRTNGHGWALYEVTDAHAQRIARAGAALAAFDDKFGPGLHGCLDECVPDLLTDLMHLIDAARANEPGAVEGYGEGWTGAAILRDLLDRAERNYDYDVTE